MDAFETDEFIVAQGKTYITIRVQDLSKQRNLKVHISDVARYFAEEAPSMSGGRTLAGLFGDWRPIDSLAQYCLEYFKRVNVEALRRESRKWGLEPKF